MQGPVLIWRNALQALARKLRPSLGNDHAPDQLIHQGTYLYDGTATGGSYQILQGKRLDRRIADLRVGICGHAFGRFSYGALLLAVRDDLGISNTLAGFIGGANVGAYLVGTLCVLARRSLSTARHHAGWHGARRGGALWR